MMASRPAQAIPRYSAGLAGRLRCDMPVGLLLLAYEEMSTVNSHLLQRLEGMQQMLMAVHVAGGSLSNSSRGTEREAFIGSFLCEVFPPPFRFGTGDVDVAAQWDEVISTARSLREISRSYGSGVSLGPRAPEKIPLYAVGYRGWKEFDSLERQLAQHPEVSGILVIESGHFSGRYDALTAEDTPYVFSYKRHGSAMALWGLAGCIHHATSMITSKTKDVPRRYDVPDA
jgi:hypothetical protein